MITEITEKTPKSTYLTFYPGIEGRHWGHLKGDAWTVGVLYRTDVQSQLTFAPAVRVRKGNDDAFLEGLIDQTWKDDCDEWMLLSVDPADGEVTMCINIVDDTTEEIDAAIARAKDFFDAHYTDLGKLCATAGKDDEDDDEDDEGIGRLMSMLASL